MRPDGDPTGIPSSGGDPSGWPSNGPGDGPSDGPSGWTGDCAGVDPLALMLDEAPVLLVEEMPALLRRVYACFDAVEMVPYLVDYTQRLLVPLLDEHSPDREPVEVDSSLGGRAFRDNSLLAGGEDGTHLWVPMLDDSDRLGALEVVTTAPPTAEQKRLLLRTSNLLARLIASRSATGDRIQRLRRRAPMTVAAEMQWNLLPPLSLSTRELTVAGILEPCYDIGGDTFDYAVNDDVLHLAVFDAMGHGLDAAQLAVLAMAAYRNARRSGLELRDIYRSIDKTVAHQFPDRFVTGLLTEMDVSTGVLRTVNAGHPGALLFRQAQLIKTLPAPTALPMGLCEGEVGVEEEKLEPGDAVLMYTDGITEARTDGEQFGVARLSDFVGRQLAARLPTHEMMRRLLRELLTYQHQELQDDASAALLEWGPRAVNSIHPKLPTGGEAGSGLHP